MRVYISGKIGEDAPSQGVLNKFRAAELLLRNRGFDVFNPIDSGLGELADVLAKMHGTTFYKEILNLDLQKLKDCDAIFMLPDFLDSKGAKAEHAVAIAYGL